MNKVWNMGLSSSFSFSIVYFLVFFQFVGALWRDYRWKTLLTPEFKSNTLPVVIFGPLTTKPWEFLGVWGLRALFPSGNLPATNGGQVNKSLKYCMKKKTLSFNNQFFLKTKLCSFLGLSAFTILWFVMVINNVKMVQMRIQTPVLHVQDHLDFQKEKVIWQRFFVLTGHSPRSNTAYCELNMVLVQFQQYKTT